MDKNKRRREIAEELTMIGPKLKSKFFSDFTNWEDDVNLFFKKGFRYCKILC